MGTYQIISLCGIQTIVSLVWSAIWKRAADKHRRAMEEKLQQKEVELERIKQIEKGIEQLKLSNQAMLRSELYSIYNTYKTVKKVPSQVATNFENIWDQYHTLADNGVMDEVYKRFHSFEVLLDI